MSTTESGTAAAERSRARPWSSRAAARRRSRCRVATRTRRSIGGNTEKSGSGSSPSRPITARNSASGSSPSGPRAGSARGRRPVVQPLEPHLMTERRADPLVDVVVERRRRRSVRQGDLDVAVGQVARRELHQLADLLGPADAAALEIASRPRPVADDPEFVELDLRRRSPPIIDFTGYRQSSETCIRGDEGTRYVADGCITEPTSRSCRTARATSSRSGCTSARPGQPDRDRVGEHPARGGVHVRRRRHRSRSRTR